MHRTGFKYLCLILLLAVFAAAAAGCGSKGYVIGVANGTTYAEHAEQFEKVKEVKTLKDDNFTLQELSAGRIDAVITDKLVGLNAIKEGGYNDLDTAGDVLYDETIGIAIRKEDDTLRQAINKALEEIIKDGAYAEISKKYFGRDILDGVDYKKTFPEDAEASDGSLQRVKDAGKIQFAMSGGYPPFNFFTGDDKLTGFDVDIGKEIAKRLGVEYDPITTGDFGALIEGLRGERYDAILGSMAITPKRLEVVDFTDPYYYSGAQLIVKKDSKIKGPESLK